MLSTQRESMQPLLEEAQQILNDDPECAAALGLPIQLGPVLSQSSASSSMNGQVQSRVQLQVAVQGTNGQEGMILLLADERGINEMILDVNGQQFPVQVPFGDRPPSSRPMPNNNNNNMPPEDVVLDAEVVPDAATSVSTRRLPSVDARRAFPSDWTTGI